MYPLLLVVSVLETCLLCEGELITLVSFFSEFVSGIWIKLTESSKIQLIKIYKCSLIYKQN